jgi:hypothetical protein
MHSAVRLMVVSPEREETRSLINADRAFVEGGDGQAEAAWPEPLAGKRHPRLDEREAETATSEVGSKTETDDDVVTVELELEEPNECVSGERREVSAIPTLLPEQQCCGERCLLQRASPESMRCASAAQRIVTWRRHFGLGHVRAEG